MPLQNRPESLRKRGEAHHSDGLVDEADRALDPAEHLRSDLHGEPDQRIGGAEQRPAVEAEGQGVEGGRDEAQQEGAIRGVSYDFIFFSDLA